MPDKGRSVEDLLRIVGAERDAHSPDEVAAAEAELKERSEASRTRLLKRMIRAGAITAAVGLLGAIFALFVMSDFIADVLGEKGGLSGLVPAWIGGLLGFAAILLAAATQVIMGLLLIWAGLAFRKAREWARKVILVIVWIAIAFCIVGIVGFEVEVPLTTELDARAVSLMVFAPAVIAFCLLILWIPQRFFSSTEVREACRQGCAAEKTGAAVSGAEQTGRPQGRGARRLRRVLPAVASALVVFIGLPALAMYLYDLHWQHRVEAKQAEYRAAGQPVSWDDVLAARPKMPDDQNAALVLLKAFDRLTPFTQGNYQTAVPDLWRRGKLGARHSEEMCDLARAHLEANAEALKLMRDAASLGQGCYPLDFERNPYAMLFRHLRFVTRAPRLCVLDAGFHAEKGDVEDAVRALSDARILPACIGDGVVLTEPLARASADAIWLEGIEQTLGVCTIQADDLRLLSRQVALEERGFSTVSAMYGERGMAHWLFNSPPGAAFAEAAGTGEERPKAAAWSVYFAVPGWREKDALFFYDVMERAASVAGMPLRRQWPAIAELGKQVDTVLARHPYAHIVYRFVMPAFKEAVNEEVKAKVKLQVARTALAIEEWRLQHGEWPQSLEQLVPELLEAVPEDPFSERTIRYARTAVGIVIYSVGEDGKDDEGTTEEEVRKRSGRGVRPSEGWDLPFRLLRPELRGAERLTFREEWLAAGVSIRQLGAGGVTRRRLSELGLSVDDLRRPGSE